MLYLTGFWKFYILSVTFLIGAVLGSFLNCYAWRIVHGEKIAKGRSHCPNCNHVLGVLDLIPVFSWVFLGGKCRYCKEKISARYPLAELICAVGLVSILLRYGLTLDCIKWMWLFLMLFTLSAVDLEDYWIPDRFLIAGAVGYFALLPFSMAPKNLLVHGLIGAAALFVPILILVLIADKVIGKESMGGGDLKLFALLGLYFGWKVGLLLVIVSCILGIFLASVVAKVNEDTAFPFGPAMSLAAWICMLYGREFVSWYLTFCGIA